MNFDDDLLSQDGDEEDGEDDNKEETGGTPDGNSQEVEGESDYYEDTM